MPIRKVFFSLTLFVLLRGGQAAEEKPAPPFDGQRAKQYVDHLSQDEFQGRMTCTEGYRKAADWAAGQFRAWGLKPAGDADTFFQDVAIRGFDWNTGTPTLHVGSREFLLDDDDFALDRLSTAGFRKKAEVVFVGYGIVAPQKGLNEYDKIDVAGKIVLVLKGSPKDAPEATQMFRRDEPSAKEDAAEKVEEEWKEESTDLAKVKAAYEQGAAAILLFDPDESTSSETRRRSSRRAIAGDFKPERSFLCFNIGDRVFRAIMRQNAQQSPRGLKRWVDAQRREIKMKRAQSRATGVHVTLKGYDTSIRYDDEHKNNVARNVLAKIEGSDPQLKSQFVLAGAHLDHVGTRNGYVYNGADDNASGSAVVLELARMLMEMKYQPKRTLVFCLWCGEERGLLGSDYYAKNPCGGVDVDHVVTYFNLDMVGMGTFLHAPGALNFPTIWDVMRRDQDPAIMKQVEASEGGPGGSDHSAFIRRGIEALALMSHGGVGHQDYHQPEDDHDKIEPEMLRVTGEFVLRGMMNLAAESNVELIIPRRKERYEGMRMRVSNFNPLLEGSSWNQVDLKADSSEQLQQRIYDLVREAIKKNPSGSGNDASANSEPAYPKKSLARGLASLKAVGTDERLLDLVIDFHGIGRVDLAADDPLWFKEGQLTDDGKKLVSILEQRKVVIHLLSPTPQILTELAAAASKPFVVSGEYELPDDAIEQLKRLGCPLGVMLDPEKPGEFLARVEQLKGTLGERGSMFAMLKSAKELEKVKPSLYLGLLDRGWARNEIVGAREHRGLMGGAGLNKLEQ